MKHLIITLGDPLGIGPEVTKKALKVFKKPANTQITLIGASANGFTNFDNFIEVKSKYIHPQKPGPSKYGADISFKALKEAIKICLKNKNARLITAPISKEAWAKIGIKFTGHTEVLKHYAAKGKEVLMLFNAGKINTALATEHLALKDVSKLLNKAKLEPKIKLFSEFLGNKKIVVTALNPHASDGGKIGQEENKIIIPTVKNLQKQGLNIIGPLPIDSAWQKHLSGKFDGIFCLYHDTALLPLKLVAKVPPVHITYGLKFLRVSPVHGTAFDIAGKNIADSSSMLATLKFAVNYK
ncbi:MAG: 4-hydroxythreonine-4-phosphate dehydrogenase PdxA [Elusimicrobiaceae bacterium]|nr:4-hydroxythreonine-4-phosphate dehydrogenase PdxA [Elusimicrobiaceae bacterium]